MSEELPSKRNPFTDDLLAILVGGAILLASLFLVQIKTPDANKASAAKDEAKAKVEATHLASNLISKPQEWERDPRDAFYNKKGKLIAWQILFAGLGILILFGGGLLLRRESFISFIVPFSIVFLFALGAYLLAGQKVIKHYNFEFPIWAVLVGLIISNTVGTPRWFKPALRSELFIKTGLVLLGSEILMSRLLALGLPGIFVSWVVTPIVLCTTYWFGQRILKIESPSLNMVISADMSVCGVSAAIATGAACKAKKEEVSLAIGISLAFTAVMMIVMPMAIRAMNLDPIVSGAWIGGTIDSTGAVAAAGSALGKNAETVAVTVKMIQNILIGVISFFVAIYWASFMEKGENKNRIGVSEIWVRFPKFIVGFIAASIIFSLIHGLAQNGATWVTASNDWTKGIREWLFCIAFVCIGLETDFRMLGKFFKGGKPLVLYVCGQAFNLLLTLAMAWLMFRIVFPQAAESLTK